MIKDRFKDGEDIIAKDSGQEIIELVNDLTFGKYSLQNLPQYYSKHRFGNDN